MRMPPSLHACPTEPQQPHPPAVGDGVHHRRLHLAEHAAAAGVQQARGDALRHGARHVQQRPRLHLRALRHRRRRATAVGPGLHTPQACDRSGRHMGVQSRPLGSAAAAVRQHACPHSAGASTSKYASTFLPGI